jgi:hypothetical protein
MSSKRKEYKDDDQAKNAARLFVACKANPATKVKVTEALQVRRYSDCESANLMVQMHVHRAIQNNGEARGGESQRVVATNRSILSLSLDNLRTKKEYFDNIDTNVGLCQGGG